MIFFKLSSSRRRGSSKLNKLNYILFAFLAGFCVSQCALGDQQTAPMQFSVRVENYGKNPACYVYSSPGQAMNFGSITSLSSDIFESIPGTINVKCYNMHHHDYWRLTMPSNGSDGQRKLDLNGVVSGGSSLNYIVYSDSTHVTRWTSSYTKSDDSSARVRVYGKIPGGQPFVSSGLYYDAVPVQIDFP